LVLRDQNNFTAVMHSSAHPEMVSFFRSLPGPRLLAAAQAGDVTTCTTLLDQGVPIDYQDEQGSSALMRACEHGHEAVARLLLQRNPPPLLLLRDKQPRTAVMLASEFDRVRVAKAFFDHLTANPGERSFMPRIELNAESMDHCMKAVCRQPFSMFRRRQVCGSCRLIVCSDCAPNKRKIPFGFAGKPSNVDANKATVGEFEITRVCTLCDQCLPK
jgi:ankyrin repeat protein